MALYLRGGIYYVDYYADGQRVQESTGTANKRKAEKFYALRLSEVQRGVYVKPVHVPLPELWERYLAHAKVKKSSWPRDQQMYGHLSGFFGPVLLERITPLRVEEYQQHRVRDVAPATVNRELALLKCMFNLAERWGLRQGTNPVRMVRFLAEDNLKLQTLSEEDERAIIACAPSYLQDLVVFALNTGLRCGDILKLKWEEIDLEQRNLNIVMEKSRKRLTVPVNDAAHTVLAAWRSMKKGPYAFYNTMTGDRFRDLKNGFKAACKQAGVSGVTWHTLRHTFASRLIRSGADIVTVKELLGHSTIVVTMRYAHTNDEAKVKAVKAINSYKTVTVTPKPRRVMQTL